MIRVRQAGLTIEIQAMAYQAPGSQTPGDGFVDLRVAERGGRETRVTLFAGQMAQIGGYEIYVERLVVSAEGGDANWSSPAESLGWLDVGSGA